MGCNTHVGFPVIFRYFPGISKIFQKFLDFPGVAMALAMAMVLAMAMAMALALAMAMAMNRR